MRISVCKDCNANTYMSLLSSSKQKSILSLCQRKSDTNKKNSRNFLNLQQWTTLGHRQVGQCLEKQMNCHHQHRVEELELRQG